MLILSLAWTLSGMTGLLGAKYYVANLLNGSAADRQHVLQGSGEYALHEVQALLPVAK